MQGRDLIVEGIALAIEATQAAGGDLVDDFVSEFAALASQIPCQFQQVQRAPRVAVRGCRQALQQLIIGCLLYTSPSPRDLN